MNSDVRVSMINGPVVRATNAENLKMREMVIIGKSRLIGEVISIYGNEATIQVYEDTEGLKIGEKIQSTKKPLSVKLGPGLIGNMFDGIQRPLNKIQLMSHNFISEGIGLISIDDEKKWEVEIKVKEGEYLVPGRIYAVIKESSLIEHKLMVPNNMEGRVKKIKEDGLYSLEDEIVYIENKKRKVYKLKLYQEWSVREKRPVLRRKSIEKPLLTGQRVLDVFFPIAKGGTVAVPGGFGTGKTMTQHQLAKWADADIIIYIGCGERGNEMTAVLEEFPALIDPRSQKSIMERTILIANTSNMPVAAREASIYTGITIAEYYRDMGYHVAMMADSTSRWAEALREISGRLEEMPAEEGYPAYLPSRLAGFYERGGYVENLNGTEGSVTLIGAVSPAGGDFSEPVTENTKRFVSTFLVLDRELAYSRHYPAINWIESYSGYVKMLEPWYEENEVSGLLKLRAEVMKILNEEKKLQEIVQLVGADVIPDDQRLILEISRVLRVGFLQQNAFHKEDTYVPLQKQYKMLDIIYHLYNRAKEVIDMGVPISIAKNSELFDDVIKIKYKIKNDEAFKIDFIKERINEYYDLIKDKYS